MHERAAILLWQSKGLLCFNWLHSKRRRRQGSSPTYLDGEKVRRPISINLGWPTPSLFEQTDRRLWKYYLLSYQTITLVMYAETRQRLKRACLYGKRVLQVTTERTFPAGYDCRLFQRKVEYLSAISSDNLSQTPETSRWNASKKINSP